MMGMHIMLLYTHEFIPDYKNYKGRGIVLFAAKSTEPKGGLVEALTGVTNRSYIKKRIKYSKKYLSIVEILEKQF